MPSKTIFLYFFYWHPPSQFTLVLAVGWLKYQLNNEMDTLQSCQLCLELGEGSGLQYRVTCCSDDDIMADGEYLVKKHSYSNMNWKEGIRRGVFMENP